MNIVNHYEWSTHITLLKSLTEVMQPKLIVELGTGLHSTPIFLQSTAEKLYFIDNDQAWLSRIQESNTFDR
jgi:tRNA1(Val) A37 N6-methylase TrmN6